jgi:hypothetical protein
MVGRTGWEGDRQHCVNIAMMCWLTPAHTAYSDHFLWFNKIKLLIQSYNIYNIYWSEEVGNILNGTYPTELTSSF